MKQNKEYWLKVIGRHKVSDISMMDKDTCLLSLVTEKLDDNFSVQTEIEYWLDENSWHFNDSKFESETGYCVGSYESENLTDEEKEKCKKVIMDFLKKKGLV